MAIVCLLPLPPTADADVPQVVPVPPCPTCGGRLGRWGGYRRWVRWPNAGGERRVWLRRVRCAVCRISHVLLPSFLLLRRLDPVATIGEALTRAATGRGLRPIAAALGVPHTTVRGWYGRLRTNAAVLLPPLLALAIRLNSAPVALRTDGAAAVLEALHQTWQRLQQRVGGRAPGVWPLWSLASGGRALAPNTSPPATGPHVSGVLVASP